MTAALTSAIKLISGSSRGVSARSKKHIGGTGMADMRTDEVTCRHSWVDMVPPHARVARTNLDRKTALRRDVGVAFSRDKRIKLSFCYRFFALGKGTTGIGQR